MGNRIKVIVGVGHGGWVYLDIQCSLNRVCGVLKQTWKHMWKRKCGVTIRYEPSLVKIGEYFGQLLVCQPYYFRLSDIILLHGHNMQKEGTPVYM